MPVSEATYERVALEDPEGQWELVCGHLRSKPAMTTEHNRTMRILDHLLASHLDREDYGVSANGARLRISTGSFYVPDLCVIPSSLERLLLATPGRFEVYDEPMPLVVEVWSPSTGEYDVNTKLPEYQLRRDLEIWLLHPYEKTLITWRLQPDGSYTETRYEHGIVEPQALPGVAIQLEHLFE